MRPTNIGLIVDLVDNSYQMGLLLSMAEVAHAHGARMVCFAGGGLNSSHRAGTLRNVLYDLIGPHNVDGVIVLASTLANDTTPGALPELRRRLQPLPVVSVGVRMPEAVSVLVDPHAGLREALEHLIQRHRMRRIGFIRGPSTNEEARARYQIYADTLAAHGLPLDEALVFPGDFNMPAGAEAIRALLASGVPLPGALVAANDYMALGALETLQERGLRVPADVALIGFDDVAEARVAATPLTTVRQPFRAQAEHAVLALLGLLRGETVAPEVILPTHPVVRRSCGCDLEPDDSTSPGARPLDPEDWAAPLARLRERVASTLGGDSRTETERQRRPAAQMIAALENDLRYVQPPAFMRALEAAVSSSELAVDDMARWHDALTVVARGMAPMLDGQRATHLDSLVRRAYVLVAEIIERARVRQTLQVRQWSGILTQTNDQLGAAMDLPAVMSALASELQRLEIPRTYGLLFDGGDRAEVALVHGPSAGGAPAPAAGAGSFEIRQLFPPQTDEGAARKSFIVLPLFAHEKVLGAVLFELGPREGALYELLRDQMSAAVHGVRLRQQVLEEIERRQRAEQERLRDELAIAARIQTMILPQAFQVDGLEIAAAMLPASEVGGDYYDVLPFPGGAWLGIGDVAGHGLATGLMALMIQSAVVGVTYREPDATPADVVEAVNAVLHENVRCRLKRDEHATLSLMRYSRDGILLAAGGHEDLLVHRARTGQCEFVGTDGPFIGARRTLSKKLSVVSVQLEPGDLVVLYTDGIIEARNEAGAFFERDRLATTLAAAREQPVGEICAAVIKAVTTWAPIQADDVTLLVARFTG